MLDDVDLLEMLSISGNVGKRFVVSSRSPGRTPLITPSKSYVVDGVASSNCGMLVEECEKKNQEDWLDFTDDFSGIVTTEKILLLKSSTHQNVVVAVPPRRDEHLSSWRVPSSGFGEVRYTSGYWEWVEDVLARCKETLDYIKTYDVFFASMFTYDHNENVLQAFCENWRPSTNVVSTFVGELSISLWNLRTIGGLPVHEENAPLVELGVEESFKDETYLAAFLACWLCKFVLPNKKADCIRASVFKVASLMAHGKIFSLAVPVLASIYAASGIYALLQTWQVNVHDLHNLAMLQGNELHIDDSGKLSTSWSDFLIGLRPSFVTLRLDDELIVEPYSLHRFSRQFGYCQDVPGALIEHHYDGPKKDDVSLPTKGEQLQEKLHYPLKSQVTPNIPPQSVRVVSKSKSLKGKATYVDNGVKGPLQTPKAANITHKEVIDVTLKRKKPSSSSDKGVVKSLGIAPSCSNTSKTSISLHDIDISASATSSCNESNVSQKLHWKRLKKKPKDLNTQQCEFAELDSISIDTAIFEDGVVGSTMPLMELAHQLGLGDIRSDVDVFEDCITSSNSLNVAKSSHLPLVEVKSQAANEIQLTKPMMFLGIWSALIET
ncbi:hypothetical protein KY285_013434 [Solanum tuberosum]|nr:hypothetical protein KY285_013434 [Solanum tuberosum]